MAIVGKIASGTISGGSSGYQTVVNVSGKGLLMAILESNSAGATTSNQGIKITIDGVANTIEYGIHRIFVSHFYKLNLPFASSLKVELDDDSSATLTYLVKYVLES